MEELHSALVSPRHVWWKPAGKQEKVWVTVSFVWCMILFAMMPLWHIKPAGSDIYLLGRMWQWYPALQLEEGKSYTLHLSSTDLNHGFNLQPFNLNFQVVPGYDYGLRITPNKAGDYRVICNEYCGIGHHLMIGKVVVTPAKTAAAPRQGEEG